MTNSLRSSQACDRSHGKLTSRQADVVRLAARGKTAKETARHLGISKNTVDEYIRDAKQRVGAATKAELIAWAVAHGIVGFVQSRERNG